METKKNFHFKLTTGFTLVELMVVLSIFAILGAMSLGSNFNSRKRVNALSADIESLALEVIDMQNRTLSFVVNPNIPNYNGHGIYIDLANPNQIQTFYKTITLNNAFSQSELPISSGNNNQIDKLLFSLGNKITQVKLYDNTNNINPKIITSISTEKQIAIFFIKPKPYANFYFGAATNPFQNFFDPTLKSPIIKACLEMTTGQNEFRHLDIFYVGQVSQSAGKCP